MPLIKDGAFAEDVWRYVSDDEEIPTDGHAIVSLSRWKAERDTLLQRNAPLGIRLKNDETPEEIAGDLDRFDVIALEFPQFKNGRAYSYARLLRGRYGYKKELRAVGEVLRDQILFMARCGIDAFEVSDRISCEAFTAAMNEITVFFQPAEDGRMPVISLRQRLADKAGARQLQMA